MNCFASGRTEALLDEELGIPVVKPLSVRWAAISKSRKITERLIDQARRMLYGKTPHSNATTTLVDRKDLP